MKPEIKGTTATHPSFAQISAARVNGKKVLYGSEFTHRGFIHIEIKESYEVRTHSTTWHHAKNPIVSVYLSEAQWATFVSSLNQGDGVPATLDFLINKGRMPAVELSDPRAKTFKDEYSNTMANIVDELTAAIDEAKGAKVKKSILEKLERGLQNIVSNLPFVEERFAEHIENLVEEAKLEANTYAAHLTRVPDVKELE